MKQVYKFDSNGEYAGSITVADNHVLSANETDVKLDRSLYYPPYYFKNGAWSGSTGDVWKADVDAKYQKHLAENPLQPTPEQQMIMALGLQVASLQETVTKLTTTNGGAA